MDQGCLYFTQVPLKSLAFIVFVVTYSELETDTEYTDMYMFGVIYVKKKF